MSLPCSARLYSTGDLARWLPDGRIEIRGRADQQVKVRGFRIEPGEIEAVLASHPDIQEAAVLPRQNATGEHSLVAWIVPAPGSEMGDPLSLDLRAWLRDRLPAPMIPSELVLVPDLLPRTVSGKVDRQVLLRHAPREREAGEDFVAPRDPIEEKLAALWSELLRVERVGVHDNFFHLGGHSLLVTRLAVRIRRHFGVDLPLRTLFEAADLAALAKALLLQLMTEAGEDSESLVTELAGMSEEEVQALLGEE